MVVLNSSPHHGHDPPLRPLRRTLSVGVRQVRGEGKERRGQGETRAGRDGGREGRGRGIIENTQDKIYGVQFHPEVTHTDSGKQIFKNFLFLICKIKKGWNVSSQKNKLIKEIKNTVKQDKVICALSGGVDSSVVALLIHKAIKKKLIIIINTKIHSKRKKNKR